MAGWLGLDNPLMYAAHNAAGGMTSIYRQIGIGCEALFRTIVADALDIAAAEVYWSYDVGLPSGKVRTLRLDGRIPLAGVPDPDKRNRLCDWMRQSAARVGVDSHIGDALAGIVFEVRQGYKSKDSKRQNADIANAASAYTAAYLPCALILSAQIDSDILVRYRLEKWSVLTGTEGMFSRSWVERARRSSRVAISTSLAASCSKAQWKLGEVDLCSTRCHAVHLGATGLDRLPHLGVNALAVRRYWYMPVNHSRIMHL